MIMPQLQKFKALKSVKEFDTVHLRFSEITVVFSLQKMVWRKSTNTLTLALSECGGVNVVFKIVPCRFLNSVSK